MSWIAPTEKDLDTAALEKRLWDAAEQAVPAPHYAETDFNPEAENIGENVNAAMCDVAKCEVRSANSGSFGHSTFVLRHLPQRSIHGVEKADETGHLCRLNLAVHDLEGYRTR